MDEPPRRRMERKSGSSSRSPSLSRRPSLKDKKVPGTITKVKGKKSGASGSKKERWLLTRKTWRYMSDAVENLLPESYRTGLAGTSGTVASTRRTSSSGGSLEVAGPSSSIGTFPTTGFHSHSADIPGGAAASRPKSMPTVIPISGQGGTGSGSGSKASSTVTSPTYSGIMSFASHRPGVTPTGPGPGKMFTQSSLSQQQVLVATEKFYPPSDDIPTLEKHFDAVCSKEKRFLLWTRTKPKGLSGPALRELKKQQKKEGKSSGKHAGSGHRDSSGSILEALHMKLQLGSSSSAAGTCGAGKEHVGGEYYSPTTEEEDDYDEYDDPDDITVREGRKGSATSSTGPLGAGHFGPQGPLSLFRPLSTQSSHGSESSYSMILKSPGVTKICRNTGTQTDPFPEELLIRFRLQAVQEERQNQQRQTSPDNQSDATTVESPMSPGAQKLSSPPPTTTASSPMSPTSTDGGGAGRASSGSGRESQEKLLETGSSTRPSISGQSESMATTKSGEGATSSTTGMSTTEKKSSEESGYSSSISDTVMRYLRMVRKNSKADNKDTIDKFKTVNYDRSLRNIKSKNVSVEEALAHEKNKLQAKQDSQQKQQQPQLSPSPPPPKQQGAASSAQHQVVSTPDEKSGMVAYFEGAPLASPSQVDPGVRGESGESQGDLGSPPPLVLPASTELGNPVCTPGPVGALQSSTPLSLVGPQPQSKVQQVNVSDSDIPPSSPPLTGTPTGTPKRHLSPTAKEAYFQQGVSTPPLVPPPEHTGPLSVGIQAGESLVRFLRNLNPNPLARKMSDFSSSCCSSESPADVFSPRYSFATTVMSGSASDTEMFSGSGGVQQAAMASMMALAAARGMHHPHGAGGARGIPQTPGSTLDIDDEAFHVKRTPFQKSVQHQSSGPLSSSWTSSSTGAGSSSTTVIKKSSSVQQMGSFSGELGSVAVQPPYVPITTSSSSSYSLSHLFHYSHSKSLRSREHHGSAGGASQGTTSTPATPTTSSIGGSSGGLMKSFFGSSSFSSTFGIKKPTLRKPTSTTSLTITTNTGSDSMSGCGNLPPPTTSSSPNLLSLIQSSAASAGSGLTNLFTSSRGGGGGSGSFVTATSSSRGGEFQKSLVASSSAASSSGELRAQEVPAYPPLYSRSSLPLSGSGSGGKSSLVGGHLHHHHHHHPHHQHALVSTSGGSAFMAKGLSDFLFSHGTTKRSSTRSTVDLHLSPSGVMQKSKSSSSVLPLYGTSGNVSATPGASSSSAHLRVSPSGSIGGGGGDGSTGDSSGAGAAAQGSSSGRLISKSKLFKSRSKSSTRGAPTSSSGSAICTWSPQGRCKWKSVTGKVVTLEPTCVLNLSDVERSTLQDVALEKLRALNLGVDVKIPKEKVGGGQQKPKRRPYLLKKKALSTGFFESGSKREDSKETTGGGSGLVFGISLSQCVTNDRLRQMKATAVASAASLSTGASSSTEWEQQQGGSHKRSQNGSRNSVSSVCEVAKEDKDPSQPPSQSQTLSVPGLVTACIAHLENYGLHTTGIFRVSTSLKRIRQLREDIDSGKDVRFGEDHSPHDVAALLKEFLRDLPEPLLCRDLYQAFLKTQKIRNRKLQLEAIQHLVQLLPVSNRDTLAALLRFFANVVANACETRSKTGELLPGNKMEGYSLATLIAPNILPCMPTEGAAVAASASSIDQNAALTKERRESIDLVNYMISNYSAIFDITPELLHDVYLHLMDTNPEAIEGILKQRCGAQDDGIDELDTTSSVFEESEGGEVIEPEETSATPTTRVYRKREEILHEGAGKGGGEEPRTKERSRGRRDEGGGTSGAATSSDLEKQAQSGGESDSSIGTRSTSRWFRRSRGDAKGRTSSDSGSNNASRTLSPGSEKVKASSRKREGSLFETKRASSLDSVNIQEPVAPQSIRVSPRASAVISGGGPELFPVRPLSGSDQSLRVPEHLMSTRRQSSPVLESSGIITASLKIPVPVPLNIDDTDIPYIEDENNGETTPIHPHYHHHHHLVHHQQQSQSQHIQYPQQPMQPPSLQQKYSQSVYQYPPMTAPVDPANIVRCRSMSTDSSIPLKTTSSSVTTTPISSPPRQPSSEVSSPGFSPPTSPPLYGTFPVEEMTARMLIGSASSSTPSTLTALSTSPSMHQFHHGAITMTTPSSSSVGYQYPAMSVAAKESLLESKSAGSTPVTKPKIEKSGGVISKVTQGAISALAVATPKISDTGTKSAPPSPQPPPTTATTTVSTGEPKGLGKETKGANIGGLIKSKTADFEKLSTAKVPTSIGDSSEQSGDGGGSPLVSSSQGGPAAAAASSQSTQSHTHHQIYSIAPKMRLRSQENVLLKQQFLMRQQQQHQQGESSTSRRERASQKGPLEESTPEEKQPGAGDDSTSSQQSSGRGLTRRRLAGSASSSAIMSGPVSQRGRARESDSSHLLQIQPQPAAPSGIATTSGSATLTTSTTTSGSSPSRWKRSEIIASRQQSQPSESSDPETFV